MERKVSMNLQQKNQNVSVEGMEMNLCDFALFLSVMRVREAHEITLRIIMDDPELKLDDVRVEEVVLNKSGKRAIRLDAWAKDARGTQYNMEMQNDIYKDSVKKRSRYYQSLMDSPILKSGKKTKYKQLPSTVVIFITQEDIFGEGLVKYTFTEQCEEVVGLHLDDGTTKIFLNMNGKLGTPELVSLLQYMKETHLENPDILVVDDNIRKLDEIVTEVLESEEWESVSMSIYSVAMEKGLERGLERGRSGKMIELVCKKLRKGYSVDTIAYELEEDFSLIQKIVEFALKFAPMYDENAVLGAWLQMKEDK